MFHNKVEEIPYLMERNEKMLENDPENPYKVRNTKYRLPFKNDKTTKYFDLYKSD